MKKDDFQKLELWMIVAFYMESIENKGLLIKDITSALNIQIKYKEVNFTSRDMSTLLHNKSDKFQKNISKWSLREDKWELWKKDNKEKIELYKKFMDFCEKNKEQISDSRNNGNKTKTPFLEASKEFREYLKKRRAELKDNIIKQCKENNIYLLGQLVFTHEETQFLYDYASYCLRKIKYANNEDIVLCAAFIRIIQETAEETQNPWDTIYKKLNFRPASKEQENYIIYKKRKDIFEKTLSYYNEKKGLGLYCTNKNNRNLLIAHAFILKKQMHEYFMIFKENKNLTIESLKEYIKKSKLSTYSKSMLDNSSTEQIERLLGKQIDYVQNKNSKLCMIDYFVNKLSTPNKYANRQNYLVTPSKKDSAPPYLIYKNDNLYIHIPTQNIEDEVNITVIFSNNEKIEKMAYLYNDPIDIEIDEAHIKYIFDDIKIMFNRNCPYNPIPAKPYRFFEKNGREKSNISSIEGIQAILFTQKNINVENCSFIRNRVDEDYKKYTIGLQDRSKNIEIDNKLFYLDTIKNDDLSVKCKKVDYIEADFEYSIVPPQIFVCGSEDMRHASLYVINSSAGNSEQNIKLSFDSAKKLESEEEKVIYIFDLDNPKYYSTFFKKDNLYKIEYTNKNKKIKKEFLLIDNINIKFDKELYFQEEEIVFDIKSPYFIEGNNISTKSKINDAIRYRYKYNDAKNTYNENPIKLEVYCKNGNTYSLFVNAPIVSLKLVMNFDNILIKNEDYIYNFDLETDFELKLPIGTELSDAPALVVDGKQYYFKNNKGKFTIEKNEIVEDYDDKPYKKNVKLYIQTNNSEYNINIGKIYNRPEGSIKVIEDDNGIVIETNYENLPGYPNINLHIDKIEDYNDYTEPFELNLPLHEEPIPHRELKENETYVITTYTDKYGKNVLDEIEYIYVPNNRIDTDYLKILTVYTAKQKGDLDYYSISNIKYIGNDLYKGHVNYVDKRFFKKKLLCELVFKTKKKGNEYVVIPQGECNLSYLQSKYNNKWELTSSNKKSNIVNIICE